MKSFLLILFMSINLLAFAQSDYDRILDEENGVIIYKGQFTFEDLKNESSFSWLEKGAEKYKPDTNTIKFLQKTINDYKMVILLGTWCEDSQNLIPQLYNVLLNSNFKLKNLSMYGVDRSKQAKYIEHKLYNVQRVPTIIIYKNNSELGRIVETVSTSIEKDIAKIIRSDINAPQY